MTGNPISFPDRPRAELDRRITDLMAAAGEVLTSQGRLRALLQANQAIVADLDLPGVLRHIVSAAVELAHATYGALGVLGPHGELEQFIHVGMPEEVAGRIEHLPQGRGLLGALITDPRPVRLSDIPADPRSSGFPEGHPPMRSFLGVPIRVRGTVYGNLYLTDRRNGEGFTEEDEELVVSLASTAGFAIENARLFQETERRRQWAAASAETTAQLLAGSSEGAVSLITARVLELAGADSAFIGLLDERDPEYIVWRTVQGADPNARSGTRVALSSTHTGRLIAEGDPVLLEEAEVHRLWGELGAAFGPLLAVPLISSSRHIGILIVTRSAGARPFSPSDLELVADFAGRVAFAFEIQVARAAQDRALLFEDRSRIARDLHDQAIQQLFGMGLQLQGVYGALPAGRVAEVVDATVGGLDAVIAQIRTIVFTLSDDRRGAPGQSGRQAVSDLIGTLEERLAVQPTLTFVGPVDTVLGPDLLPEVLAVISEAVTNAAKHAGAEQVEVSVAVRDDRLMVEVRNDGRAFQPSERRSGLGNMTERAERHGGTMTITTRGSRTSLVWAVPLEAPPEHAASGRPADGPAGTKVPAPRRQRRTG
jgi:signal transduction histidine kinase